MLRGICCVLVGHENKISTQHLLSWLLELWLDEGPVYGIPFLSLMGRSSSTETALIILMANARFLLESEQRHSTYFSGVRRIRVEVCVFLRPLIQKTLLVGGTMHTRVMSLLGFLSSLEDPQWVSRKAVSGFSHTQSTHNLFSHQDDQTSFPERPLWGLTAKGAGQWWFSCWSEARARGPTASFPGQHQLLPLLLRRGAWPSWLFTFQVTWSY